MTIREKLNAIAAERVLILDGAMGSMIQALHLTEAEFRGRRFADHPAELKSCIDLLCLTKSEVISSIHEAYLKAGADIIETCSFNATAVSLADYGIGDLAYEISAAAARLARKAADDFSAAGKPRFVAGSMGPTSKSAGLSPDMNDPAKRGITWDELERAYYDNARGLLDGGADILVIETIIDSLNAKAALSAVSRLMEERGIDIPVMLSATIAGAGRLLTGQNLEAFCVSVLHGNPWALGLNCSFGAERLKVSVREMAAFAPCLVSAYPNAGMPNQSGGYDDTPEKMAAWIDEYLREGLVNIVGGCCGSTPAHIAAIAQTAERYPPRKAPPRQSRTFLAGLEALPIGGDRGLAIIGERTNAAENEKILSLIKEEDYDGAVEAVREMVEAGAAMIDVRMDALPDAKTAITRFLNLALAYPDVARFPVMIDSSRWEVIEAALKLIPGKALVNSISLKDGEAEFLRRARLIRRYGAAVVLFDDRSYELLTGDGFPPEDIILLYENI